MQKATTSSRYEENIILLVNKLTSLEQSLHQVTQGKYLITFLLQTTSKALLSRASVFSVSAFEKQGWAVKDLVERIARYRCALRHINQRTSLPRTVPPDGLERVRELGRLSIQRLTDTGSRVALHP